MIKVQSDPFDVAGELDALKSANLNIGASCLFTRVVCNQGSTMARSAERGVRPGNLSWHAGFGKARANG